MYLTVKEQGRFIPLSNHDARSLRSSVASNSTFLILVSLRTVTAAAALPHVPSMAFLIGISSSQVWRRMIQVLPCCHAWAFASTCLQRKVALETLARDYPILKQKDYSFERETLSVFGQRPPLFS